MKRILALLAAMLMVYGGMSAVHGQEQGGVSFALACAAADNNRIFPVQVFGSGNGTVLSAAKLVFTYDTGFMEYRSVETASGGEVKAVDHGGRVTVIYLNNSGVSLSERTLVCNIKFKAVNSGTATVKLACYEAVNSNGADIAVVTVEYITLTISGGSVKGTSVKVKNTVQKGQASGSTADGGSSSGSGTGGANGDNYAESMQGYAEDITEREQGQTDATTQGFGFLGNTGAEYGGFLAGAGTVILLGGIFAAAFHMGRKSKPGKTGDKAQPPEEAKEKGEAAQPQEPPPNANREQNQEKSETDKQAAAIAAACEEEVAEDLPG